MLIRNIFSRFSMMENRYLFLIQVLLFGILIFLLKTGQCAPKKPLPVTEKLVSTNDVPKSYLPDGKLDNENKSPKNISVRRQLGNDHSEAPKKYIPVRMQHDVNGSAMPKKYISFLSQQNETYLPIRMKHDINGSAIQRKNISLLSQQNETYLPVRMQHNVNVSAIPRKNISFPIQQNGTYQNTNGNASKKHTHVKRQFDYVEASRRHIRQNEEDGEEDSEQADSNTGEDLESATSGSESDTDEPVDSGSDTNEADDSGSKADSEVEEDTDSRDSEESVTKKPAWPTNTWTEVMVLFRKDVRPEKLHLNVGRDNIFRMIGKALESSRQTELDLLKLKEVLKK